MADYSENKDRFFGRRKGRKLNKGRHEALRLLDQIGISQKEVLEKKDQSITSEDLFTKHPDELWLEVGFGNGDLLAELHRKYPNIGFIGAEPFINGVSALLKNVKRDNLGNLRIWPDDVRLLLQKLQPATLNRIYVLNPDPWPKRKHHKRRFISPENLNLLSGLLKTDGEILMTTDVDGLAEWMAIQISRHPDFMLNVSNPDQMKTMPENWIPSRYETKGQMAGRSQYYIPASKISK